MICRIITTKEKILKHQSGKIIAEVFFILKNIAVFFGGKSVERDVSVITGVMASNCIDKEKYNAIPVYVTEDGAWYTGQALFDLDEYKNLDFKKLKQVTFVSGSNKLFVLKNKRVKPFCSIYCALNCMHGGVGENGSLSGVFNALDLPSASPDVLSSSVSMDKAFTKTVMKGLGVKTLPYKKITENDIDALDISPLTFPVIVKPNGLGSSVGVTVVKDQTSLKSAVEFALRYDATVIIEPFLQGVTEINCAGFLAPDDQVEISLCERPVSRGDILSFSDKYQGGKRQFPADIDEKIAKKIQSVTKKVYQALNFNGVIRIDYFVQGGTVYLNEINSVPGSLANYLFGESMADFTRLINQLIETGVSKNSKRQTLNTKFNSGILTGLSPKGSKRLH